MVHELGHVLVQEPLVSMDRVACSRTNHNITTRRGTKLQTRLASLTGQRTLSWWRVLSDKRQELVLGLLQGDLTGPHSLSQARLKHKVSQFGFSLNVASGKQNHFTKIVAKFLKL